MSNLLKEQQNHPKQSRCIYFREGIQTDSCIHLWLDNFKSALHVTMIVETFDNSLYVTIEDSIFALGKIPEVQIFSENLDKILYTKSKKIYIPRTTDSLKKFLLKTSRKTIKTTRIFIKHKP